MNDKRSVSVTVNSFPIMGLLFLLFLGLKLTGQIDWSWWWVTAPLWGTIVVALAIWLGFLLIVALLAGLGMLLLWWGDR